MAQKNCNGYCQCAACNDNKTLQGMFLGSYALSTAPISEDGAVQKVYIFQSVTLFLVKV